MERKTSISRSSGLEGLKALFESSSSLGGEDRLKVLVRGLGELLEAETTFLAFALDDPATRVRGITAWKDGAYKEQWEYDLAGNPCQLTYNGSPTFIPCGVAEEFENKRESGYASYIGIPLKSASGRVLGHIAVYAAKEWDVDAYSPEVAQLCGYFIESEVRHMTVAAELAQKLNDMSDEREREKEIVRTVSHDIRGPLFAILGVLDLVKSEELPENISGLIDTVHSSASNLAHFANDYLDLERIRNTELQSSFAFVDLSQVIRDALSEMENQIAVKGVVVDFHDEIEHGSAIQGDHLELIRVIINLVSNALKVSVEGQRIDVSLRQNQSSCTISVRDHGPGVPDHIAEELFLPFKSGLIAGTGLGMSITKAIVDRHGGEIGFSNETIGARFFVKLPKSDVGALT